MIASGLAFSDLRYSVGKLIFASPLYRYTLAGRTPPDLYSLPPDPWPGKAIRGAAILKGEFEFFGEKAGDARHTWQPAGMSEAWLAELHSFEWLRDLRALGGDAARRKARELTADWLGHQSQWDEIAWRPDVLARRIFAWLGQHDFFCASADNEFRHYYLTGLARQGRHLSRVLPGGVQGEGLLAVTKGLIAVGLAMEDRESWVDLGLRHLEREIEDQLLADGGHISRNPSTQLRVLQHLIDIRSTLLVAGWEPPGFLMSGIDRAAPFVRMLRHGDGGLALFNGSSEDQGWRIDMLLSQADARGRPPSTAPHTGFQRLVAMRTVMLVDVGAPPTVGLDADAHAGTLSLELSVGRDRLIVNCGALADGRDPWPRVQRATAAHSTLVIDDTNSSPVPEHGRARRPAVPSSYSRRESSGNIWLGSSHDGYVPRFGLRHHRRLYLGSGGDDIRGEDALVAVTGDFDASHPTARSFKIRFHLHPQVRAEKEDDEAIVTLKLPSGAIWRLKVEGGAVHVADSIYLGDMEQPKQPTRQVVVSSVTGPPDDNGQVAVIKWALRRIFADRRTATARGQYPNGGAKRQH